MTSPSTKKKLRSERESELSRDPFLGVVENNDMESVQHMMETRKKSLARRFSCIRDAFAQAIRDNHIGMLQLLLEGNLNIGGAIFHAIDEGSFPAVEMICKKLQSKSKLAMQTYLNAFADDDEFPRYTTPLLFASCRNQQEIVKTLIEFGAEFPNIDAMVSRAGDEHYDIALSRLHYYQAISSEAYLLSTPDPLDSAFHAGKLIRTFELYQLPSLRTKYRLIHDNLDLLLSKLLMKVDSTEEIKLLLCRGGFKKSRRFNRSQGSEVVQESNDHSAAELTSTLPKRLQDAITLDYRQFLVTPNCQEYVLSRWYHGRTNWRDLTQFSFTTWTLLVIIFKPLLCLLYILIPMKFVKENLKAPYVRFLLHFTSRMLFVFLLLESTISAITRDNDIHRKYEGYEQFVRYIQYVAGPPDILTWCIYIFIIGMTWREIKEFWWSGARTYFQDWFNWVDICQLFCYWIAIVLHLVAFANLHSERLQAGGPLLKKSGNESIFRLSFLDSSGHINKSELYSEVNVTTQHIHRLLQWDTYGSILVSEAAFAIANVLTFLAVLHDCIILSFVGPLLVSFIGMIADIARFGLIFIFVWISFGIGFTQLYQTFTELEAATCEGPDCFLPPFATLQLTMRNLFWSLFDLMDLDSLESDHESMIFTEIVGIILYGVYMLIAVIVMVNALIAMMSNTYTRVEENSEVEWKRYRTKLMAQYMTTSPTLPPPYNIVPTVKTLIWIASCTLVKFRQQNGDFSFGSSAEESFEGDNDKYERLIGLVMERYLDESGEKSEQDQEQEDIKYRLATMTESMEIIRSDLQEARDEVADAVKQIKELLEATNLNGKPLERSEGLVDLRESLESKNSKIQFDDSLESRNVKRAYSDSSGHRKGKLRGILKKGHNLFHHHDH